MKTDPEILCGLKEAAEYLRMSVDTLDRLLRKYPWAEAELPNGKANGKWRVPRAYWLQWWEYVLRQETRHPEARRMRPEEPPEIQKIVGR